MDGNQLDGHSDSMYLQLLLLLLLLFVALNLTIVSPFWGRTCIVITLC